jgi:hypothetical protein
MLYVGLDIHSKHICACALNEQGQVTHRTRVRALDELLAPGVDGMTWLEYEDGLDDRLVDLHRRAHTGTYRAQPSKRAYIPKPDGRKRPLGIAALEDKIVQQADGPPGAGAGDVEGQVEHAGRGRELGDVVGRVADRHVAGAGGAGRRGEGEEGQAHGPGQAAGPTWCLTHETPLVLTRGGLRYHGRVITHGAQTERRGGAGPVRGLLGGKDRTGRFSSSSSVRVPIFEAPNGRLRLR